MGNEQIKENLNQNLSKSQTKSKAYWSCMHQENYLD